MTPEEKIRQAMTRFGGRPAPVVTGKVQSVDWAKRTCVVDLGDGRVFEDVQLRAVADDATTGLALKPKVDSYVMLLPMYGSENDYAVVLCSEVEAVYIEIGQTKVEIEDGSLKFNDGNNGGLVKVNTCQANMDAIKDYLNNEKTAISAGFDAVGSSTAASGAAGKAAFEAAMLANTLSFDDMENADVKH